MHPDDMMPDEVSDDEYEDYAELMVEEIERELRKYPVGSLSWDSNIMHAHAHIEDYLAHLADGGDDCLDTTQGREEFTANHSRFLADQFFGYDYDPGWDKPEYKRD